MGKGIRSRAFPSSRQGQAWRLGRGGGGAEERTSIISSLESGSKRPVLLLLPPPPRTLPVESERERACAKGLTMSSGSGNGRGRAAALDCWRRTGLMTASFGGLGGGQVGRER